jgi:hypothetical protein
LLKWSAVIALFLVASPSFAAPGDDKEPDSHPLELAVPAFIVNTPQYLRRTSSANLEYVRRTIDEALEIMKSKVSEHALFNAPNLGRIKKITIKPVYATNAPFHSTQRDRSTLYLNPNADHKTLFPTASEAEIYLFVDRVALSGKKPREDRLVRTVIALSHALFFDVEMVNKDASQSLTPQRLADLTAQILQDNFEAIKAIGGRRGHPFSPADRVLLVLHAAHLETLKASFTSTACSMELLLAHLKPIIELPKN